MLVILKGEFLTWCRIRGVGYDPLEEDLLAFTGWRTGVGGSGSIDRMRGVSDISMIERPHLPTKLSERTTTLEAILALGLATAPLYQWLGDDLAIASPYQSFVHHVNDCKDSFLTVGGSFLSDTVLTGGYLQPTDYQFSKCWLITINATWNVFPNEIKNGKTHVWSSSTSMRFWPAVSVGNCAYKKNKVNGDFENNSRTCFTPMLH